MFVAVRTCLSLMALYSSASGAISGTLDLSSISDSESREDVQRLVNRTIPDMYKNISSFSFNPRGVPVKDTSSLVLQMYREMDLITHFNIPVETLARFILRCEKGYRDLPYHNWIHGFSVLQFSFAVLRNCKLLEKNHVTPLEGLALLTAAMCHDVDHLGTNNKFQEGTNSSLSLKYKDQGSILERHHIDTTLNFFSDSETNFIAQMEKTSQNRFKDLIKEIILATDLQAQMKKLSEEQKMVDVGFNSKSEQHRQLLRAIIISCADLSDQARDWSTARQSVKLLFTEFFAQGDEEKKLGLIPWKMMDRNQANIAQVEVEFISQTTIPDFRALTALYPETKELMDNIQQNLVSWVNSIPHFQEQANHGRDQLDILLDSELDNITSQSTK